MTLMDRIRNFFAPPMHLDINDPFCRLSHEVYVKNLAVQMAVNLISSIMSQAEFKTFYEGNSEQQQNYYLFNVEPNQNYSSSSFWRGLIHQLVFENEALVIMVNEKLYLADSFTRKEYAFKPNEYQNITVNGEGVTNAKEDGILYFTLHNSSMTNLINGLYDDYGKLIEYSKKTYKVSNARRGVLEIPTSYPKTPEAQEQLTHLMEKHMEKFYKTETGAVLPLTNGIKYTDLTNNTYKNGSDSRDIRALIDDVFDFVALAFQIPPQLLKGSVAESDNSIENLMMFCINPLAKMIEDEVNRKFFSRDDYLQRTYLKIDTSTIRVTDIGSMANAIDILTRNGVNTLDDNMKMLGREPLYDEISTQRFMTLNLAPMESIKGGEQTGNITQED